MSAATAPFKLIATLRWFPLILQLTVVGVCVAMVANTADFNFDPGATNFALSAQSAESSATGIADGITRVTGSGMLVQLGAATVLGALLMAVLVRLRRSTPVATAEGAANLATTPGRTVSLLARIPVYIAGLGLALIAVSAMVALGTIDTAGTATGTALTLDSLYIALIVVGLAVVAVTVVGMLTRASLVLSAAMMLVPVSLMAVWIAVQAGALPNVLATILN